MELFWPSFKVGQTMVEKMHFCRLSRNWVLKVDLGTNLRDKHGHLFFGYLELFCPSFNIGQIKVENMHFCRLSWNWNFETWFRYPFERYAWTLICMIFGFISDLVQGWSNQSWKYALFLPSWNWNFKVDLITDLRDKHVRLFLRYLELFWPSFKVG